MATFAARIRRSRLHADLSQADLAQHVQVSRSAAAQWEIEGGTRPSVDNLARIAVVTRVRFEWLATGRGAMKINDSHQAPALGMSEFAHDELESRLLAAIRRISESKRSVIVQMVEGLAR